MDFMGNRMPLRLRFTHRSMVKWLMLLGSLTLALTIEAASTSWPMFRGNPGLTGVSEATLPSQMKLAWSFKTQGPVKSSAAIGGGKVFIGSNDEHLYALDLKSG